MSKKLIAPEVVKELIEEAKAMLKKLHEFAREEMDDMHRSLHEAIERMGKNHSRLTEVKLLKAKFKAALANIQNQGQQTAAI